MKVAITSSGVEGQSAKRYWEKQGADVTILDWQQSDYLENLDDYDLIVRSPGTHPGKIKTSKPVTSVTNEFMLKCPVPVIGVTGTKGKGTTSSLIAKMLEEAGYKVWLGGNIGVPALDFLDDIKAGDKVVLELSSFQLMDASRSPQTAVMLMVAPEHLNVHADMEEYLQAKANIFRYQKDSDLAVYYADDPEVSRLVELSSGKHVPYFDPTGAYVKDNEIYFQETSILPTSEIGLLGEHNWQNVCAAVAAVWGTVSDPDPIRKAVREFSGLPHRLKLVADMAGVRYYDDSISTTPESTIAAIRAFDEPKVLILGGSDKGAQWDELAHAVKSGNVTKAIIIGDTAEAIGAALSRAGYTDYEVGFETMSVAVQAAASAATTGSVVLLSPACASFGMFKDYKDRGDQFIVAAQSLDKV